MLELYITRSGMRDGLALLDLGCGWGSVALHMAHRFPGSKGIRVLLVMAKLDCFISSLWSTEGCIARNKCLVF